MIVESMVTEEGAKGNFAFIVEQQGRRTLTRSVCGPLRLETNGNRETIYLSSKLAR